jgi:hypothetical protein
LRFRVWLVGENHRKLMRRDDPWRKIIVIAYPGWLFVAGDGEFFRLMNPQIA